MFVCVCVKVCVCIFMCVSVRVCAYVYMSTCAWCMRTYARVHL